jgi:ubiquitin-conjugating enzyme E2 M
MLNILSLKKKQQQEQQEPKKQRTTAAQIRIQKDLSELSDLPKSMTMNFPDSNNLFDFELTIKPDDGTFNNN